MNLQLKGGVGFIDRRTETEIGNADALHALNQSPHGIDAGWWQLFCSRFNIGRWKTNRSTQLTPHHNLTKDRRISSNKVRARVKSPTESASRMAVLLTGNPST
jgi:hypothetical protein